MSIKKVNSDYLLADYLKDKQNHILDLSNGNYIEYYEDDELPFNDTGFDIFCSGDYGLSDVLIKSENDLDKAGF